MKRSFILIVMALLLISSVAVAEEAILIDFTKLDSDITMTDEATGNETQENRRTVMDFGAAAGATFTEDQKGLMKTSLALPNWEVVLNSSAKNVTSVTVSQVVYAPVRSEKNGAAVKLPFAGSNVMGVRIKFPIPNVNSNAKIVPPFEIPAYEPMADVSDNGEIQPQTDEQKANGKTRFERQTEDEECYGIAKNVGTLKKIAVTTMGMNFPHALYVLLKDTDGIERRYFMGYLGFDGWRELIWNNPQYISEIRQREIRVVPIYPRGTPFVKFTGFQVTRDALHDGDDFIGYFKDVKIIYDKAILDSDRDINDEDLWGIITTKEAQKQSHEMSRFGDKQVNRFLEKEKMAQEEGFTSSIDEPEETAE